MPNFHNWQPHRCADIFSIVPSQNSPLIPSQNKNPQNSKELRERKKLKEGRGSLRISILNWLLYLHAIIILTHDKHNQPAYLEIFYLCKALCLCEQFLIFPIQASYLSLTKNQTSIENVRLDTDYQKMQERGNYYLGITSKKSCIVH